MSKRFHDGGEVRLEPGEYPPQIIGNDCVIPRSLFDRTMARYPKTMARLAREESSRDR